MVHMLIHVSYIFIWMEKRCDIGKSFDFFAICLCSFPLTIGPNMNCIQYMCAIRGQMSNLWQLLLGNVSSSRKLEHSLIYGWKGIQIYRHSWTSSLWIIMVERFAASILSALHYLCELGQHKAEPKLKSLLRFNAIILDNKSFTMDTFLCHQNKKM